MKQLTPDQTKKMLQYANANDHNIKWRIEDGGVWVFSMKAEAADRQLGVYGGEKPETLIALGMLGGTQDGTAIAIAWPGMDGELRPFPIKDGNIVNAIKQAVDWTNSHPTLARTVFEDLADFTESQSTDTGTGDGLPAESASTAHDAPATDRQPSVETMSGPH